MTDPKRPPFAAAFKSGLFYALTAVSVSAAGMALIWKTMSRENSAYIQQSLGDTAQLMGMYVRTECDHFLGDMKELADQKLKAELAKREQDAKVPTVLVPEPAVNALEMEADILDVALWRRGDSNTIPQRAIYAMNSRFAAPSTDLLPKVQGSEPYERAFLEPAFHGHTVVIADKIVDPKNLIMLAVPLGHGDVNEIAVAHVRLERFTKAFQSEGMAFSALLDGDGTVLAASSNNKFLTPWSNVGSGPLYQGIKNNDMPSGQINYTDTQGNKFFGGFRRIGLGQLVLLSSISDSEASLALYVTRDQTILFLAGAFLLAMAIGYLVAKRRLRIAPLASSPAKEGAKADLTAVSAAPSISNHSRELAPSTGTASSQVERSTVRAAESGTSAAGSAAPERRKVTVLHGSLRQLNRLLETLSPEDSAAAINDYFSHVQWRVDTSGGIFERYAGSSFLAIWGATEASQTDPHAPGTEERKALRCALDLQKDLKILNEARKVDGMKLLSFGMGIHSGIALAARLGPEDRRFYSVVGEPIACARSLDQLSVSHNAELLVSQAIWQESQGFAIGELKGEARLTIDTGLTPFFLVRGYRDDKGNEIYVEASVSTADVAASGEVKHEPTGMISAKPMRWLVNNGSQIVGPLGAKEIAGRLFEQELDFDCECWVDGTGKSAQIGSAGIFSGSEDEGAVLWVFDGETIHGPISPGFLKTAVACGAISENSFICENSTVNGWKTLQAWNSAIQPAAPLPVEKERPAPSLVSVTPAAEARNDYGAARIGIGEPAGPLSAAHAQPVTETKVPVADLVSEVHDAPVMSPQTPPVVPPPPPAALLRKPAADAPAPAAVTSPSEDDSAKAA